MKLEVRRTWCAAQAAEWCDNWRTSVTAPFRGSFAAWRRHRVIARPCMLAARLTVPATIGRVRMEYLAPLSVGYSRSSSAWFIFISRNLPTSSELTVGHFYYLFICMRPRGSITHQQPKHTQTHPEYLKHMQPLNKSLPTWPMTLYSETSMKYFFTSNICYKMIAITQWR